MQAKVSKASRKTLGDEREKTVDEAEDGEGQRVYRANCRDGHCPSAVCGNINAGDHWSPLRFLFVILSVAKYLNAILCSTPLSL